MAFNRRLLSVLIAVSATTTAAPTSTSLTSSIVGNDSFSSADWGVVDTSPLGSLLALNDATLDELRGGFTAGDGLQISFGIERAVYINGDLVTTTSLNVTDMTKWTTDLTQSAGQLASTIVAPLTTGQPQSTSTGPSQSTASTPVTASPQAGAAVSSVSQTPSVATSSSGQTSSAATAPSTTQTQVMPASTPQVQTQSLNGGSLALIQSGAGNTFQSGPVSAGEIGTIVQNSLNDQKIQSLTVINSTVNSMQILNSLNLQHSITTAVINSLGR